MTIQSVPLSSIEPSKGNPRRGFDRGSIEGLAASIRKDGLLHNLVVSPLKGKGKHYRIVSGERRFRALKLLAECGDLSEDFVVPVEVRNGLSKDDTLRIATVENLQRQNLAPLEETAALTKLIHKGVTLDDVAAQTGLSPTTIKRRLALNGLCKDGKEALANGTLSLSQAEALTLGDHGAQRRLLGEIDHDQPDISAEAIREFLIDDRPTVALAIFPLEKYTGTITTDLFAEGETSYFDDAEQFFALQKDAVAELVSRHAQSAAWVETTEAYRIPDWQYDEAGEGEAGGVLINLSPSGKVEIREGLTKRIIDRATAEATADHPLAPKKSKAAYSAPLCRYIAWHKSAAVQEVLLCDPRKVKEVAVIDRLKNLVPHEAVMALAKSAEPQGAYKVIEAQASHFAAKLGFEVESDESVWVAFPPRPMDILAVYDSVKALSDHDLDDLHAFLTVLAFGQNVCERLETHDSLFNRVAADLGIDMRTHWRPDWAFLDRRNREQLVALAKECGYTDAVGSVGGFKKGELVNGLIRHFANAQAAADPTPAQKKARDWQPDAMRFPVIDPDTPSQEQDDEPLDDPD